MAAIITPSSLRRMSSAFKCLPEQMARNIRAPASAPLPNQVNSMLWERAGEIPTLQRRKRIIEK